MTENAHTTAQVFLVGTAVLGLMALIIFGALRCSQQTQDTFKACIDAGNSPADCSRIRRNRRAALYN